MTHAADIISSPRLLLGPGPSMVHPRVLRAMATPPVGHMDPQFFAIMDETQALLRPLFQTTNRLTFTLPGTGSAGMEAALLNFLEAGDSALICVAGFFAERMVEIAGRATTDVRRVDAPWGQPIRPEQVEEALRARPAKMVAIVHGETSTGVRQPLAEIAEIAHRYGALLLVDTVASLGGVEMSVDEIGVDICYTGSQKCLSVPPGLAPITISPRAEEVLRARKTKVQTWYLDLTLIQKYWATDRAYHHTGPINMQYAMLEGLRMVADEGLPARFQRHAAAAQMLWDGLEALGLKLFVPVENRLATLTTVVVPDGVDDVAVRRQLLLDYNIEIAAGLGQYKGKLWRVGLMGYSARPENVATLLGVLARLLPR
jgi:alanine-glyoxylate transaminase/serine-glyoxylate transaminase/serine-pyruvate transaminase